MRLMRGMPTSEMHTTNSVELRPWTAYSKRLKELLTMRPFSKILHLALVSALAILPTSFARAEENILDYFPQTADPLVGDYVGRWSEEEEVDPEVAAQVIALGRDKYRVRLVSKLDMRCPPHFDTEVKAEDGVLEFRESGIDCKIADGKITGGRGRMKTFALEKVVRTSPTIGAKAPDGAVVLFDGSNLDRWTDTDGWEITEDGALMVTPDGSYIASKDHFSDVKLHVEFRTPFMPKSRGQQRGNSGVFFQKEFEVQVLDSYGLEGYNNECGALYKVAAPKVNACAPPLQWQTYDVEFRAARFDADGEVSEVPRITVRHNGVLIHNDQEIPWITGWKEVDRLAPMPNGPGPIRLQGHNNFVQFRNIWLVDQSAKG